MWERIKGHGRWLWSHRTKAAGIIGMGAGFAQNNLAQLGHVLPAGWNGVIVASLGVIVFAIGLFNSLNL